MFFPNVNFRRPTVIGLAVAAVLAASTTASGATIPAGNTGWFWSNPLPQGNSLVRVSASGGRVWAGGTTGTLLRSDDQGRTWSAVRTGLLAEVKIVEAISADSVIFGGNCALRRSDDSGVTVRRLAWSASDDNCSAGIQAVSFPTSVTGFLLLTSGDIYATSDGGDNWKKRGVAPQGDGTGAVNDMVFQTPQRGVVSVGGKILQSTDGGVTWKDAAVTATGSRAFSFAFANSATGLAAGDHGELLRTLDGGETWIPIDRSPDLAQLPFFTDITCGGPLVCIAEHAGGGSLQRTDDGGATWHSTTVPGGVPADVTFADGGSAVAVGAGGMIARSTDAGASFSRVDAQVTGAYSGLAGDSRTSAVAWGTGGSIARTLDGGLTWRGLTPTGGEALISAMAAQGKVLALEETGVLLSSADGGATWRRGAKPSKSAPGGLLLFKGGRSALIGPRGVFVSPKWGARAKRTSGPAAGMTLRSGDLAGSAAFVYGPRRIAVTGDRGRTWKALRGPRGSAKIVKLDMVDRRYGFLLDAKAEVFVTRDGARRWHRLETTGANSAVSLAFGDRRHGYITDSSGRILATADGGATFSRQYPFFDEKAASPMALVAPSRLGALTLVSGTNRIYATTSGGAVGQPSVLTIRPSSKRVRRGSVVSVTGTLTPATGIERVSVLARVARARGGTQWTTQNVTVSPQGTFTTRWKITADTVFIARWSGDFAHDGDGAAMKIVRLRR